MSLFIFGRGTDAGYWEVVDGKLVHHGGWNPESLLEFGAAVSIIANATQLKTPGLAEAAIKSVAGFAERELAGHIKGSGATVIVVAQ